MVLIDRPNQRKTSAVMKIDTGMATSAITGRPDRAEEEEQDHRDEHRRADQLAPAACVIEASMKLAWRKVTCGASMPAGSEALRPSSASSMERVSAMVSAAGCFGRRG